MAEIRKIISAGEGAGTGTARPRAYSRCVIRLAVPMTVAALLLTGCTSAERSAPDDPAPLGLPSVRPQACTSEIINAYFDNTRRTAGNTFDREATVKAAAEAVSSDCARLSHWGA